MSQEKEQSQNQPILHVELQWGGSSSFQAKSASGANLALDGKRQQALSPMEALLASLSACMGIDVVNILTRMRAEFSGLTVTADGEQNPQPPKSFNRILIAFEVQGKVPRDRVEHAIRLSFETYCSVFHCLRRDIEVAYDIKIRE